MPRKLRVEYPGAIYHVMNRGDHQEAIFKDEEDRRCFVKTLGEVCGKTDWQVHAVCLMTNHFHLVLETPKGNLVKGRQWFLSTYTARFNRRHKIFGPLFSGRYQALIVDGSGKGDLKTVCDDVHLNPARAGLMKAEEPLSRFLWSSWPEYLKRPGKRWPWLRVDQLLGEYAIPKDSAAGRRRLEEAVEQRRGAEDGDEVFKSIRRGWFYGEKEMKQELLEQMNEKMGENHDAKERRESSEEKARRILLDEMKQQDWAEKDLKRKSQGDRKKVKIAPRLRAERTVTLKWIAEELQMGTWRYVSNLLSKHRRKQK